MSCKTDFQPDDLKVMTTVELFNVLPSFYTAEEKPSKVLADTWFNETITKMEDISFFSLNNAFLHAARLELSIPKWWLIQWSKHMTVNFTKLSVTDLANGLYSLALLRVKSDQFIPFLEKCSDFFQKLNKKSFTSSRVDEFKKLARSNGYFKRENDFDLHFYGFEHYKLREYLQLKKEEGNKEVHKILRNHLQKIIYYPPGHIINKRSTNEEDDWDFNEYKNSFNARSLDQIILKNTGFRIIDRANTKFIYRKSEYDRETAYEMKSLSWNEDLGDYIDLTLPNIVYIDHSKEEEPGQQEYENEKFDEFFSMVDSLLLRSSCDAAIVLLNEENYFQGKLNADTKLEIYLIESEKYKTILIDHSELRQKGIHYILDIFSFLLPAEEMLARIQEYPFLIEKRKEFDIDQFLNTVNADVYFSSIKIIYTNEELQKLDWFNEWLEFSHQLMSKTNITRVGSVFCELVSYGLKPSNIWLTQLQECVTQSFSLLSIHDIANVLCGFSLLETKSEDILPFLEKCKGKLNTLKSSEIENSNVYQKLCKSAYFYTYIEHFNLNVPYRSKNEQNSNKDTDSTELNIITFFNKIFQYPSDHPSYLKNKMNNDNYSPILDDTVIYLKSKFERNTTYLERNSWMVRESILTNLVIRNARTTHRRRNQKSFIENIYFIFVTDKDYKNHVLTKEKSFDLLLLQQQHQYVYVLNLDIFRACGDSYLKHFLKKFMWECEVNDRLKEFDHLICDSEDDVPDSYQDYIIQIPSNSSHKKSCFNLQEAEGLFSLIRKKYVQEMEFGEEELHEWFKQTQTVIARINPEIVTEAFLHLGLFNKKPPFWWVSTLHRQMNFKFNRLSLSSMIDCLFAVTLLKIDPKQFMPFINKCQQYFKEKDKALFGIDDLEIYKKSFIFDIYYQENTIDLGLKLYEKFDVLYKLRNSSSEQTKIATKEISEYLTKIYQYPENHPCHNKVTHSYEDDYAQYYKKKIDHIEKNGILQIENHKYKFTCKKSSFNRYERIVKNGDVEIGMGNCVRIKIEPTSYFEGKYCGVRKHKKSGFNAKEIYVIFIKPDDYFMGKIRSDLMWCIENAQKKANVILINLEQYQNQKFAYLNELFSSILPAAEIEERVKEFDSLINMTEKEEQFTNCY